MTPYELGIIVKSILTLAVFVILVAWLWPMQRMYLFRQEMFAVRDELFDFAADDGISFEDPAYIQLRQLFNGFIRYAHNLTPFRVFMSFLKWKMSVHKPVGGWSEAWNHALENVRDVEAKKKLRHFHSRATDLVLGQLLLNPTVLVIGGMLLPFFLIAVAVHVHWTNLRSIYRDLTREFPMAFLEEEAAHSL